MGAGGKQKAGNDSQKEVKVEKVWKFKDNVGIMRKMIDYEKKRENENPMNHYGFYSEKGVRVRCWVGPGTPWTMDGPKPHSCTC